MIESVAIPYELPGMTRPVTMLPNGKVYGAVLSTEMGISQADAVNIGAVDPSQ